MKSMPFEIDNIAVIPGENAGRFPFCNSLFINDSVRVIVDPGAGLDKLLEIKNNNPVDLVLNTHYHFDHIVYNHIFNEAKVFINEIEGSCFTNRNVLAQRLGMEHIFGKDWAGNWQKRIKAEDTPQSPFTPQNRHEWWLSTSRMDGTYKWGEILDFGKTKVEIIGTPGHTGGFSCLYFPEQGVVYTADYDLSDFGPWYFGADGDIELFISSAKTLTVLNADYFITGHEHGVLPRREFISQMERFLGIITKRDNTIINSLKTPLSLREITELGLIYGKRYHIDEWLWAWEMLGVHKHLKRLVDSGLISFMNGKYLAR